VSLFRDADGIAPKSRFSLASPGSPYLSLDPDWVHQELGAGLDADILTMDCLLLVSPGATAAAHRIAEHARRSDCLFAVDVVPHNLLDYVEPQEFLRLVSDANLVTVEMDTFARIIDTDPRESSVKARAKPLYSYLKPHLATRHWVVIRYGALNIEHSVVFASDGRFWHTDSGAEIRSGGYPSGSRISSSEYEFIVTQWKHEHNVDKGDKTPCHTSSTQDWSA
jgi:hypothetical protein